MCKSKDVFGIPRRSRKSPKNDKSTGKLLQRVVKKLEKELNRNITFEDFIIYKIEKIGSEKTGILFDIYRQFWDEFIEKVGKKRGIEIYQSIKNNIQKQNKIENLTPVQEVIYNLGSYPVIKYPTIIKNLLNDFDNKRIADFKTIEKPIFDIPKPNIYPIEKPILKHIEKRNIYPINKPPDFKKKIYIPNGLYIIIISILFFNVFHMFNSNIKNTGIVIFLFILIGFFLIIKIIIDYKDFKRFNKEENIGIEKLTELYNDRIKMHRNYENKIKIEERKEREYQRKIKLDKKYHEQKAEYENNLKIYRDKIAEQNNFKQNFENADFRNKYFAKKNREYDFSSAYFSDYNNEAKGRSEKGFLVFLKHYFGENIYIDKAIPEDWKKLYAPDFIFSNHHISIDIEIDEPYTIIEKKPIHYYDTNEKQHTDIKRDNYFLDKKWIVIRFAEIQIVKYPKECCQIIANVVYKITGEKIKIDTAGDLKKVPFWTSEDAMNMAKNNFRNTYTGKIDEFQELTGQSTQPVMLVNYRGIRN